MHLIFDQLSDFADELQRTCANDGGRPPLPERVLRVRLRSEPTHLPPVQQLILQASITVWHRRGTGPVPCQLELRADCGPVRMGPRASVADERATALLQRLELLAIACALELRPW